MKAETALYLVAAAMILIGFLVVFFSRRKRRRCTQETDAAVVAVNRDVSRDDDGKKDISYYPVFEFSACGRTVRSASDVASGSKRKYKIGDVHRVRFNPDRPEEFYVVGAGGNLSGGVWLIALGVLIAAAAILAQAGVFSFGK